MRCASYSRGLTSRRSRKPKFLSARTTCAMLTRSWGSWRTTAMLMDRLRIADCGLRNCTGGSFAPRPTPLQSAFRNPQSEIASSHQLQHTHPRYILPIPPHPHPAVAAAPHQLPGPARAARQHLVHQQVEPPPPADVRSRPSPSPVRPDEAERHAVSALGSDPCSPHAVRVARGVAGGVHPQCSSLSLGNNQVSGGPVSVPACFVSREVDL